MSLLLALGSLYIAGKVLEEVGKDVTKIPARSKVVKDEERGKFDVVRNFEEILTICEVKRKKHGNSDKRVLPYNGYNKCLQYIREHHLTCKADEQRFITHYRKVLAKELENRQGDYDKHYEEMKNKLNHLINTEESVVIRFEHTDVFMDKADVQIKVDELFKNTFLGRLSVNDPKITEKNEGYVYHEIWALKVPNSLKFRLEEYYKACAEHCGYIN